MADLSFCPRQIHYVSPEADMSIIDGNFNLIFSCHNLEHQVDLIEHFSHLERLLSDDGIFACVVPDATYTFDYYKDRTEVFDIIATHLDTEGSNYNDLKCSFAHPLLNTHNSAKDHWMSNHGSENMHINKFRTFLERYLHDGEDLKFNCHRWIFSYDSFKEIFNILYELGLIKLNLIRCYNPVYPSNAFHCIFKKVP